jgi:hypothetical protein
MDAVATPPHRIQAATKSHSPDATPGAPVSGVASRGTILQTGEPSMTGDRMHKLRTSPDGDTVESGTEDDTDSAKV